MTYAEVINRVNRLPEVIPGFVSDALTSLKPDIIEKNKGQLAIGQDSMGKAIKDERTGMTTYKTKKHIKKRQELGKQTSFIDLNLYGDFYDGIDVAVSKSGISITSTDGKTKYFDGGLYGNDLFGLNEENMDWVMDQLVYFLTDKIRTHFT